MGGAGKRKTRIPRVWFCESYTTYVRACAYLWAMIKNFGFHTVYLQRPHFSGWIFTVYHTFSSDTFVIYTMSARIEPPHRGRDVHINSPPPWATFLAGPYYMKTFRKCKLSIRMECSISTLAVRTCLGRSRRTQHSLEIRVWSRRQRSLRGNDLPPIINYDQRGLWLYKCLCITWTTAQPRIRLLPSWLNFGSSE